MKQSFYCLYMFLKADHVTGMLNHTYITGCKKNPQQQHMRLARIFAARVLHHINATWYVHLYLRRRDLIQYQIYHFVLVPTFMDEYFPRTGTTKICNCQHDIQVYPSHLRPKMHHIYVWSNSCFWPTKLCSCDFFTKQPQNGRIKIPDTAYLGAFETSKMFGPFKPSKHKIPKRLCLVVSNPKLMSLDDLSVQKLNTRSCPRW